MSCESDWVSPTQLCGGGDRLVFHSSQTLLIFWFGTGYLQNQVSIPIPTPERGKCYPELVRKAPAYLNDYVIEGAEYIPWGCLKKVYSHNL